MTSAAQEVQARGDAMTSAAQEDQAKEGAMTSADPADQAKVDRMALPTRAVQGQEGLPKASSGRN